MTGILVACSLVLVVIALGLAVQWIDIGFEGDAITLDPRFALAWLPTWRVPFGKIRKIEVFRPRSAPEHIQFLVMYLFAGGWFSTVSDRYLIVETNSRDYVFSVPDPEGFATELEPRRQDWIEGPKPGKWRIG